MNRAGWIILGFMVMFGGLGACIGTVGAMATTVAALATCVGAGMIWWAAIWK
jgi:cytochrome c biogenesis protein CcdA